MCGIAGVYHVDGRSVENLHLMKMTNLVRHRGPDDEGYVLINTSDNNHKALCGSDTVPGKREDSNAILSGYKGNLGMGFRRLSILDLTESGHQPMGLYDGAYWIVFNGEVYNYQEIRKELIQLGISFHSDTDTEVILQAYVMWGVTCLKRFNGMFAFAIWDSKNGKLFCARDRRGIKPFYYYFDGKSFYWASEIKQLVFSGLITAEPDPGNIANYLLSARLNIDKQTFFRGIKELVPACFLIIENGQLQLHKYWDVDTANEIGGFKDADYADMFREIFTDAVRMRLRSDVPLGISLSGGLDSSSIACVASSFITNPIKTFSVYYTGGREFDEREYIDEILKTGNFSAIMHHGDNQVTWDELMRFFYHQDEPTMSASPFSAYRNHQNIRKNGIVVVLNGQGGDELLAGYHTYFKYYYLDLIRQGKFKKLIQEYQSYTRHFNPGLKDSFGLFAKILLRIALSDQTLKRFEYHDTSNKQFYNRQLFSERKAVILENKFRSSLKNSLYNTLTHSSIPHLLHWEDRNSMAWSVESRVPFLDYKLIELVFSMPDSLKIRGPVTKFVLRESMKGILPEKVRTRMDKVGFATPTDLWMNELLKDQIMDVFESASFRGRNEFNAAEIAKRYRISPQKFKPNEIWRIFSLEMWYRIFIDRSLGYPDI